MDQRPRRSCLGFLSAGACTEKHHEPRRLPARIAVRAAQGGGSSWGFLVTPPPEDIPGVRGSQEGPTGQLEKNVRLTRQKLNHRVIVGAPQGEQPAPLPRPSPRGLWALGSHLGAHVAAWTHRSSTSLDSSAPMSPVLPGAWSPHSAPCRPFIQLHGQNKANFLHLTHEHHLARKAVE